MKPNWTFRRTITDREEFKINGLNIWDHKWINTGEQININDPLYGQKYTFQVFEIQTNQASVKFAAGEFSNCVWGIYLNQ